MEQRCLIRYLLETSQTTDPTIDSLRSLVTHFFYKKKQQSSWKHHITEPKTPLLQTSLRARPPKVKSSLELEQEELEKIPKFKARPLNKKVIECQLSRVYPILRILFFHLSNRILFFQIFESKGDIGVFCLTI